VEAGLLELLFDIDLAKVDEGLKVSAHPGDFETCEATFGDVDGLAGEVRRGGVAPGGRGVAVGVDEALLESDGADGGVDLEWRVEGGVVVAGEDAEEGGGPGAGEAAVFGETVVDAEGITFGQGYELILAAKVEQVGIVSDAVEAVMVGHLILVEENFVGAVERWRND
jgi:hypothetical protein